MDNYLVIDVGGSRIKYALMNTDNILEKGEALTPQDSVEDFIESLVQLYQQYEGRVKGLALSVPGRIDIHNGIMHTGGYLGYIKDLPLIKELQKFIPVKISVENDGKCAALAELWKGTMVGVEHGVVVVLGTGVGGGIIVNGKLLRGSRFGAGELSWLPISLYDMPKEEPYLWAHLCGTMGLTDVYEFENGLPYHTINGRQFFDLVHSGNESANQILNQFAKSFAIGVIGIQAVLDTEVIAIGGGISAQPILIEKCQEALDTLYDQYEKMPIGKPKLVRCAFANDSNLYGALYHHLYE